jgi:DHA1 family bicyclomycin/chloramphenicol resistance-like MFS transporter
MLVGLGVYLLSSVACMLAPSIDTLIAARFFQALGACAGPVLGRAIVRDVYGPVQAARVLAYISGAMAIAPMIGPFIGGARSGSAVRRSPPCLCRADGRRLHAARATPSRSGNAASRSEISAFAGARRYLGYLLCVSFTYAALFSFISGSSFVLIDLHGLSPQWFGASFGVVVTGYICGTLITGRFTLRLGPARMVRSARRSPARRTLWWCWRCSRCAACGPSCCRCLATRRRRGWSCRMPTAARWRPIRRWRAWLPR